MSDASSQPTASSASPANPGEAGGAAILRLDGVTKRFGGLSAVDSLSFSVRQGEILGIIGPNGAGKSTMIGLIGGAISPSAGSVSFMGRDVGRLRPSARARLGIARTFQVTQPFTGLDVRENVLVGALFGRRSLRRTEAMKVADEVLERVGLATKATLKGDQLTVADRKRLEVARALATEPTLLLLDEVMSGLTPVEVTQAVELIRDINRAGVTILVVEHIVRAIRTLSDRILVLHHGRKIAEDLPDQVLSDPMVIEAYLGERYARQQRARQEGAEQEPWKEGLA